MDSELEILIRAITDVKSADDATKELVNRVFSKLKDGAIELPINSKLDKSELKKLDDNVKQARKEVVSRYNKLQKEMADPEGFNAFSDKAINELVELGKAYAKFNSKASGQSKNSTAAVSDVKAALGEVFQLYENEIKLLNSKIKELNLQDKVSKNLNTTRKIRGPRNFGPHSKEEIDANIEQDNKRKYKGLHSIVPREASTTIEAGRTNKHLMKLSEYSSHGSNWATELSRILKIEIEKAAENLTSWIEPNYKVGGKDNKIGLGNTTPETTEKQFLGDTIKAVKNQLTKAIRDLESGSEEITLDTLKEYAAVIKVLTKAIGKTTEDAEKTITSSIEKVYNSNTEVKTRRGTKSTLTKIGGVDRDEGKEKGVGVAHDNTQKLVKELYKSMRQWDSEVIADTISKEMISGTDKTIKAVNKNNKKQSSNTSADKHVSEVKLSSDYKAAMDQLATATDGVFAEVRNGTKVTQAQMAYDKIENVREAVSDSNSEKIEKNNRDISRDVAGAVKKDVDTGFNTNENARLVIDILKGIWQTTTDILKVLKPNDTTGTRGLPTPPRPLLPEGKINLGKMFADLTAQGLDRATIERQLANASNSNKEKKNEPSGPIETGKKPPKTLGGETQPYESKVEKSNIYATPFNQGFWNSLRHVFDDLTGATKKYTDILKANADDQDAMAAERVATFGLNNGRNPNDTGDIAGMRRILQLYRTNKTSIDNNPELQQKIQLTKGREVDTTEITKTLNKALSGPNMRNAQMGGSPLKQVFGAMTGFIGMPSLEKSRAQADGMNQVLGNINKALQSVLVNIQTKETELAGMEERGDVRFNDKGFIEKGTSAAYKTLADLEEEKLVLDTIQADLLANDEIIKRSGGNYAKMAKHMKFMSPVLRENNAILRNITSGLDKNGKALKFQKRTAEILNYTFQLMSRSIGQMLKSWLVQLNPINLIKKAFQDFASYDPKWQRTMNVIKYNLRSIILPLMQKIAQLIVNMIGVLDIALQKVQSAFGKTPISLFDQENAKKFKEEVEEAKNITAGFDELHDIGDSDKDPNDLSGEIYKPQLSEGWKKVGETLGNIFTAIAKAIQWCIDNWKLLAGLLAAYVVGKGLLNLLTWGKNFSSLLSGLSLGSLISSIGIAIGAALTLYGIFQDIKLAQDWDQMTPEQRTSTANKGDAGMGIGGGLIGAGAGWKLAGSTLGAKLGLTAASGMAAGATFAGGIALGISGTSNAITAATNGNYEMVQKESTKAGTGIGMALGTAAGVGMAAAGTKVGALLGAWAGPVGAAFGAVIGAGVGFAVGKTVTYFKDVGGEFSKLKISQEDLTWATEQYTTALGNEYVALQDLTGMEQALGQSGADLYKQVENGTVKYNELTTEQKILLKAYEDYQSCLKTTADALKQQVDYENAILMTKAEESGDYSTFIASMQEATNQGIYSSEEMRDRLSQVYAELSAKEREVFLTQIPEDMRQGVESGAYQYYSGWEQFKVNMATGWENFKAGAAQLWEDVKTTAGEKWEGIKTTCGNIWEGMKTTAGTTWENMKTTAGNIWNSIKIEAGETWEGIKNSAVGQKVQEMATNVATKWNEMKIKAGETWNNIKTTASQKWDEIKNSAIGQKVQETWKNVTTKFNEIKNTLTTSWNTLKTNANTAWNNIKGSIVDAAKNAWEGAKGFFNKIADGVKKAWESLKELAAETGQKIGNFVSGNGWKTNAEVNYTSVASYAVGTNYVPSDGLAYLHQGEAVVPKKYNQPYQQQGLSSEEREYMSQMIKTMQSLDATIGQGITVNGQFVQKGSDLVATVEKANNRLSNNILSNRAYAR
jgi:hypothetical protein